MMKASKKVTRGNREKGPTCGEEVVEVYMIKIYRRSKDPERSLVGIIEDIKGHKELRFMTDRELMRCLKNPGSLKFREGG